MTRFWHFPRFRSILMAGLIARALLWLSPTSASFVADIDLEQLEQPGLVIIAFVSFDAVIPIFQRIAPHHRLEPGRPARVTYRPVASQRCQRPRRDRR